jgi:adenosylcobinamide amidohydrolase
MPAALGEDSVQLLDTEGLTLRRRGRFLVAHLRKPHLVLSTSQVNGGQTEAVRYLLNHQSCEGRGHTGKHHDLHKMGKDDYHRAVCSEAGIPHEATALMGTAANMQYASVASATYQEATVWAAATAGVQGNAGRAGDAAAWHEGESGYQPVHAVPGTINVLLLFNCPLTPAALTRAVATMTEAKSAVLQELAVGSRYSEGLATGTGTDQFCLASPLDADRKPKSWTGKHAKLGELIGKAVMDAVREALRWQNGLEPSRTRHLAHALGRFGVEDGRLLEAMGAHLDEQDRTLLAANFQAILHEPQVAGAAYALAAVRDRLAYGTLPHGIAQELLANQAALMAAAVAAKTEAFAAFRAALSVPPQTDGGDGHADIPALVARALALGWQAKWK